MVEECCQYSVVHFITAYGKASKKAKRRDYGGIGASFIYCSNEKCDFVTDTDYKSEKYPDILMSKENGLPYCLGCGQAIDWKEDKNEAD